MPLKNLHSIEQPREKLIRYGAGKLSDTELFAILLHTGPQGTGVLELSKKLLRQYPEAKIANAGFDELQNIRGLGPAKACEIVACFELGRRLLKDKPAALMLSPREVWEQCRDIRDSKKEHFVVFFLDTQHREIKRELISLGTLNASLIHPREVFEPAVKCSAAHILAAHNHPGGSLEPSGEDLAVTKRLVDSGRLLGIEFLDHVIVTADSYSSMKEKNLL